MTNSSLVGRLVVTVCVIVVSRGAMSASPGGNPSFPATGTNTKAGTGFVEPDGVYRFGFELADADPGYRVVVKNYLDDLDPKARPAIPDTPATIRLSAARDEFEPAAFVIYATRELKSAVVEAGSLTGKAGTIPASEIEVRRVVRTPMRRIYTAKIGDAPIVGRFLPRWQPMNIPAGEFREVWLTFHIPPTAAPGDYQGHVTVAIGNQGQNIPVALHVYPFELKESAARSHGMYYSDSFPKMSDAEIRRDLRDQRHHGIRHVVWGTGIDYAPDPQNRKSFRPDLSDVRRMLALMKQEGFGGMAVFGTRFEALAMRTGHTDVMRKSAARAKSVGKGKPMDVPPGESLDGDQGAEFRRVAKAAMEEFKKVQAEYPQFRLVATHLDEVFNQGQLPLYIRLTKIGQQVPGIKFYITFNTAGPEHDAMRKEIDPCVDVRCNHGYSFEWWLARGHTMDEYKAEVAASGDEAWFYHNARGAYCTPQWARIINGIYLWTSPFSVHCPWTYRRTYGNPFDDGDNERPDFGFAFPDPDEPTQIVTTRLWEAMREGFDDVRYMATLTELIKARKTAKPREAGEAQAFLDELEASVKNIKIVPAGQDARAATGKPGEQVDADTGLVMGIGKTGTVQEAPLIYALMLRYSGERLQAVRATLVEHILRLSEN